ncbi:MAG: hypothetical protein K1X66_04705 [Verrucomicrobiae bacterium]|nr:hypothetical protein [Verrucomicrobiae bacterium]
MFIFRTMFLMLLFSFSLCGETVFTDPLIQKVVSLHDQALNGNSKDVQKAEEVINQALLQSPDNQLLRAYLGSLLTIKSSKALPGIKKWKYFTGGLKMMDDAVDAAPHDVAVRLVRAMNNSQLPRIFNRRDNARADFQYIFRQFENDPQLATEFNTATQQAIYYNAGVALLKSRATLDAKEAWEKGLALGKNTAWGEKMAKAIEKIQKKTWRLTQS